MFESVLVADRGLVACRVIRTCHRLGVRAVAVHSAADRNAMHARVADEAFLLGSAPAAESYSDVERLIEAAQVSGVQAVHPGRAFLAEDADAADAVRAAGLVWVGPSPATLRSTDPERFAGTLAAAGVPPAGPGARVDLEVQLLGLPGGRVLVLGARTVVLRVADRPTVVEEPALVQAGRRAAAERSAARLAEQVELVGLATVDLALVDSAAEDIGCVTMRNRLQLGHAVTELVSGVDLVEQQLLVAAGDDVNVDADALRPGDRDGAPHGYAASVRVSAVGAVEPIRITQWETPQGDGVRVDASYRSGDRFAPYYEPLLAEVAAWGPDRRTARGRLAEALAEFRIGGPASDATAIARRLQAGAWLDADDDVSEEDPGG